jgi:cytochrome P450
VTKFFSFGLQPEEIVSIERDAQGLRGHIGEIINERRRSPREDIISSFLAAATEAGEISPDTTSVAIAMRLRCCCNIASSGQRYIVTRPWSPVPSPNRCGLNPAWAAGVRVASEDIEVGGTVIPGGQFVTLSTMSAMRDEKTYDCPDPS